MKRFPRSLSLAAIAAALIAPAFAGVTITDSQLTVTITAGGSASSQFSPTAGLSSGLLTGTIGGLLSYSPNPAGAIGTPTVISEFYVSLAVDTVPTWIGNPTFSWNYLHQHSAEQPPVTFESLVDTAAELWRYADANGNLKYDAGEFSVAGDHIGFTYVTSSLTGDGSLATSGALPPNPATAYGNATNELLLGPGETWVLVLHADLTTQISEGTGVEVQIDASTGQGFSPFKWTFNVEESQVPEASTWVAAVGLLGLTLAGWIRRR